MVSSTKRLQDVLQAYSVPLLALVLISTVSLLIGTYFPVGWELDAGTRAEQALFIAQRGPYWYFFQGFGQGYYVWLPLWQFLLAGIYLLTGINPTQGGIIVSAVSAGLIGLMVSWILKARGFARNKQLLGALLLLTSGYFVAYASQGMTDVFSGMLFLGSIYCFYVFVESRSTKHLAIASVLTLLNVTTRYEAWLFLLVTIGYAGFLFLRRTLDWKGMIRVLIYAAPSVFFVFLWLYYNLLVSGSYLGFAVWIAQNVMNSPPPVYHNSLATFTNYASALLLSNGLLWVPLVDYRGTTDAVSFQRFGSALFAVYSAYFLYSTYAGLSDGWVRFMLYFLPLSAVGLLSRGYRREYVYLIVGLSIALGVVGFLQNASLHLLSNPAP